MAEVARVQMTQVQMAHALFTTMRTRRRAVLLHHETLKSTNSKTDDAIEFVILSANSH